MLDLTIGTLVRVGSSKKVWTVYRLDEYNTGEVFIESIVPTGPRKGYRQAKAISRALLISA